MSFAERLPRGRRNLQQRHRLLLGTVPSEREWRGQLQGPSCLQDHLRAMCDCQGLLFGGVRRGRALPERGRMFPQRRALPIQRRLLLGHVPHGSRGGSSLRRRAGLQVHRDPLQEIRRVLRRHGRVQCRQPLPSGQRLSNGGPAVRPAQRLLLEGVRAQPHGQTSLSRFMRPRGRPMHQPRGLLRGKVQRFSRALLARPLGSPSQSCQHQYRPRR